MTLLPAIPERSSEAVVMWAKDCDDLEIVQEVYDRMAAVTEYLARVIEQQTTATTEQRGLRSLRWSAAYLDAAPGTLRYWNQRGIGPRSYKVGKHRKYRVEDLDAWLETRAVPPR